MPVTSYDTLMSVLRQYLAGRARVPNSVFVQNALPIDNDELVVAWVVRNAPHAVSFTNPSHPLSFDRQWAETPGIPALSAGQAASVRENRDEIVARLVRDGYLVPVSSPEGGPAYYTGPTIRSILGVLWGYYTDSERGRAWRTEIGRKIRELWSAEHPRRRLTIAVGRSIDAAVNSVSSKSVHALNFAEVYVARQAEIREREASQPSGEGRPARAGGRATPRESAPDRRGLPTGGMFGFGFEDEFLFGIYRKDKNEDTLVKILPLKDEFVRKLWEFGGREVVDEGGQVHIDGTVLVRRIRGGVEYGYEPATALPFVNIPNKVNVMKRVISQVVPLLEAERRHGDYGREFAGAGFYIAPIRDVSTPTAAWVGSGHMHISIPGIVDGYGGRGKQKQVWYLFQYFEPFLTAVFGVPGDTTNKNYAEGSIRQYGSYAIALSGGMGEAQGTVKWREVGQAFVGTTGPSGRRSRPLAERNYQYSLQARELSYRIADEGNHIEVRLPDNTSYTDRKLFQENLALIMAAGLLLPSTPTDPKTKEYVHSMMAEAMMEGADAVLPYEYVDRWLADSGLASIREGRSQVVKPLGASAQAKWPGGAHFQDIYYYVINALRRSLKGTAMYRKLAPNISGGYAADADESKYFSAEDAKELAKLAKEAYDWASPNLRLQMGMLRSDSLIPDEITSFGRAKDYRSETSLMAKALLKFFAERPGRRFTTRDVYRVLFQKVVVSRNYHKLGDVLKLMWMVRVLRRERDGSAFFYTVNAPAKARAGMARLKKLGFVVESENLRGEPEAPEPAPSPRASRARAPTPETATPAPAPTASGRFAPIPPAVLEEVEAKTRAILALSPSERPPLSSYELPLRINITPSRSFALNVTPTGYFSGMLSDEGAREPSTVAFASGVINIMGSANFRALFLALTNAGFLGTPEANFSPHSNASIDAVAKVLAEVVVPVLRVYPGVPRGWVVAGAAIRDAARAGRRAPRPARAPAPPPAEERTPVPPGPSGERQRVPDAILAPQLTEVAQQIRAILESYDGRAWQGSNRIRIPGGPFLGPMPDGTMGIPNYTGPGDARYAAREALSTFLGRDWGHLWQAVHDVLPGPAISIEGTSILTVNERPPRIGQDDRGKVMGHLLARVIGPFLRWYQAEQARLR